MKRTVHVEYDDALVQDGDVLTYAAGQTFFAPAAGGTGYLHVQSAPAATWIVNHNLGVSFPSCVVYDDSGAVVDVEIVFVSVNQIRIYFVLPTSGHARVN